MASMDVRLSLTSGDGEGSIRAFLAAVVGLAKEHNVDVVAMKKIVEEDLLGALVPPAKNEAKKEVVEPKTKDDLPFTRMLVEHAVSEPESPTKFVEMLASVDVKEDEGPKEVADSVKEAPEAEGKAEEKPEKAAPTPADRVFTVGDIPFLGDKNAHARDAQLTFEENAHKYTIITADGSVAADSVTTLIGSKSPFNADMAAAACLKSPKWAEDETYDYYKMEKTDIKALWDFERELGTELHRDIEIYLNAEQKYNFPVHGLGKDVLRDRFLNARLSTDLLHCDLDERAPDDGSSDIVKRFTPKDDEFNAAKHARKAYKGEGPRVAPAAERQYFLNFMKREVVAKSLKAYRTEWRLWDADFKVAGTVDLVCDFVGKDGQPRKVAAGKPRPVVMFDWKRTKKPKKSDYARQLNFYKWLLERNYNVEVKAMYIVRLHPNAEDYDLIEIDCPPAFCNADTLPLNSIKSLSFGLEAILKARYEGADEGAAAADESSKGGVSKKAVAFEPMEEAPAVDKNKPKASPAEEDIDAPKMPKKEQTRSWAQTLSLKVDGVGPGMIDDMSAVLDDSKVQFCLVKIPVGTGTFARNKMIYVEWVGENVPVMKRAKHIQKGTEIKALCDATATYACSDKSSMTLEDVVKDLKNVFVTDSGNFSTADIRAEMEKRVKAAAEAAPVPRGPRKTAKDMNITAEYVLKEIRKNMGRFNWVLLEASVEPLKLFNAGSKSIEEMAKHLDEMRVLFGLLRLGFGTGIFRRTKWIGVTFVGENVKTIQRGQELQKKGDMENVVKPFSNSLELQGAKEVTVPGIIGRVKPFLVIDEFDKKGKKDQEEDNGMDCEVTEEALEEAFRQALAEEIAENAEYWGDDDEEAAADTLSDYKAIIKDIKDTDGVNSWGVFSYA